MMTFTLEEIYLINLFRGEDLGNTILNIFDELSNIKDEGYKELLESALGKLIVMSDEAYESTPFGSAL